MLQGARRRSRRVSAPDPQRRSGGGEARVDRVEVDEPRRVRLAGLRGEARRAVAAPGREQALQLVQRPRMVVGADAEVGEVLGRDEAQRGGLLAARVAARALSRLHRREEAGGHVAGAKYHKVDKAPWQRAMLPIYQNWAPKVGGREMIKAVQDTP